MLKALVLAALALGSARTEDRVEITARDLDGASIERGVAARLGTPPLGWHISIEPGPTNNAVHLHLSHEDGREIERDIELEQIEVEARSREVAAMLALVIEQSEAEAMAEPPTPRPQPEPEPTPPSPRTTGTTGWIGVLGRAALNAGRPGTPDVGAGLAGGVWLDRLHLQPVAQVAWSRAAADDLRLDAIRFGAGLMAGTDLAAGRVWLGGGAIGQAMWATARAQTRASGWVSVSEIALTAQYRATFWTVGARVGVDLVLPPLHAHGNAGSRRWDAARPAFGLLLGLRIPPRWPSSGR